MTDPQIINQFNQAKFRIASLESILSDKQKELEQFRNIEEQADNKIKILTKVHADKVKSLLNSIQILKKEKATIEGLSKEHKRSKLIQQLNKEILDQDIVIEVLRKQFYDDKGKEKGREICDNIIVKALTKGPDRIRPLTREELRMQIDRLKIQGSTQQTKMRGGKGNNSSRDDVSEISSVSEKSFVNQGEQAFVRIRELQGENQSLKLELATKGKIVEKLKAEGREKDRLRAETELLTNELEVAQRRAETYERLLRQSKQSINGKVAELYTRQLRVEQLQLNSKQSGQRLKQAHESANILLQEMKQEKEQLNVEYELLKKENEQILLQNITLKKRFEEQKNKINEVRTINNKNKEQFSEKLKMQEQALQKLFDEHNKLQETCRSLESTLFKERGNWVEEKANLIKEVQEHQQSNRIAEQNQKVSEEIDQLRKQNRDLKDVIESGGAGKNSNDSVLLQRLENYRMRLEFYEKGESKGLYDQLFTKYSKLLQEFEDLKKNAITQKPKRKNLVEITTKDERDLQEISSGISNLHLEDIDSDVLDNFDSDYDYELKINNFADKKFNSLPKMSEEDQELLKLINSNLWDFVKDEQIEKKIEEIMNGTPEEVDDDLELKKRIRQLKNISHPRGKKVMLYDSELRNIDDMSESVSVTSAMAKQIDKFDSDVDLEIKRNVRGAPNLNMRAINSLSDRESQQLDLSSAKSGDSSFAKRKKGQKASVLKLSKQSMSSVSSKSDVMNSDVSSINVNDSLFNEMNSDVSVDFRRKKINKR